MHKLFKQLIINTGLNKYKDRGHEAVFKEGKQLHQIQTCRLMNPVELSTDYKIKSIGFLVSIKENRYGSIKGRAVAFIRPQRENITM